MSIEDMLFLVLLALCIPAQFGKCIPGQHRDKDTK